MQSTHPANMEHQRLGLVLVLCVALTYVSANPSTKVTTEKSNLVKGKVIQTLLGVGKTWELSFEVKPIKAIASPHHTNLVHVSTIKKRDRKPGVWVNPSLGLHICTVGVPGCVNTKTLLPCNFHKVVISVRCAFYGTFRYTITIDGKVVKTYDFKNAKDMGNVNVYGSDPWYTPANAHLRNVVYKTLDSGCPIIGKPKPLLLKTATLQKDFHLSFSVKANGIVKGWGSIVHVTTGKDSVEYGSRIPGIWFKPGTNILTFGNDLSGKANVVYYQTKPVSTKQYTHVAINQSRVTATTYVYTIHIDGKLVFNQINTDARVFKKVKFYVGDPWHTGAKAYIKDILWKGCVLA